MKNTKLISGDSFEDFRGKLNFNNSFVASKVKRIYIIENVNEHFIRGWQGHKIEQRWFCAVSGSFKIELIRIDNWETPSKDLKKEVFKVFSEKMDILHIPPGFVTSIKGLEEQSKLLVMSDYLLNEIEDNFKFPLSYFE